MSTTVSAAATQETISLDTLLQEGGFLDFFQNCAKGVYPLSRVSEIDLAAIMDVLSSGLTISAIRTISYEEIFNAINELASKPGRRDSSVRSGLLDMNILDWRSVPFCSCISCVGYSGQRTWGEICYKMHEMFLNEELPKTSKQKPAYYWYDAIKMLANWLDLSVAAAKHNEQTRLLEVCNKIMGILPTCVPLGFVKHAKPNTFAILCE